MGIRSKVTALTVVAGLFLVLMPLAAQTSNTKLATSQMYSTNVDNFLSVDGFMGVPLKDWFGYVSYDNNYFATGYARRIGDIYLGLYYNGYLLSTASNPAEETTVATSLTVDGTNTVVGKTVTSSTQWMQSPTEETSNNIKVLLGLDRMGFKLGFDQYSYSRPDRWGTGNMPSTGLSGWTSLFSHGSGSQIDSQTEIMDSGGDVISRTVTRYEDGLDTEGYMKPSIQWGGLTMNVGSMTLKPDVTLLIELYNDTFMAGYLNYSQVPGEDNPSFQGVSDLVDTYIERYSGFGNSYLGLDATFNFSLDLASKGDATQNASLSYQLQTKFHSNPYQDQNGKDQSVGGSAAWYESYTYDTMTTGTTLTTLRAYEIQEKSNGSHIITPSYTYGNKLGERISFAFKAQLPTTLELSSTETSGMVKEVVTVVDFDGDPASNYVQTINKTYEGNTVESFGLTIAPTVEAGLQYNLFPNFTLNSGLTVTIPRLYNLTTTTTKPGFNTRTVRLVNADGSVTTDEYSDELTASRSESQSELGDWNPLSAAVSAGFAWNMGEGLELDARMNMPGNFRIDTATITVLLSVLR